MRFFIVLLLLFCSYFSVANATENKTTSIAQKSIKKLTPSFDKAQVLLKRDNSALNKEPFNEHLNRIHQNIHHHTISSTLGFSQVVFYLVFHPVQSIQIFRGKVNYSYQFIFNCLFPKHTFW